MVFQTAEEHLQGLAQWLVQEKFINKKTALEHQQIASDSKQTLLNYWTTTHFFPPSQLALHLAAAFGFPFLDLDALDKDCLPINLISEKLIRRYNFLPLYTRGEQLYLAVDDPSQLDGIKEIQFHSGMHICPIVVETAKLSVFINQFFAKKAKQSLSNYLPTPHLEIEPEALDSFSTNPEDAPLLHFVGTILENAVKQEASDIHFELYENCYRIRYRLDGLLEEISSPPLHLASRIIACIKIMAKLDITERRLPQDGRFKRHILNRDVNFRISTCPTIYGEKLVIRLLESNVEKLQISHLGLNELQKKQFLKALKQPQGMILVTGPTGSGKTTTLYSALNFLNATDKNISTVEDPVEIKIDGLNQVTINSKIGLTFATSLRAFLRQDPDIIMVGEIRDLETADIVVKAAQTGHLLLSTLHTNSAIETLTRLFLLGVAPLNLANSLSLLIAQRLARRLCEYCKQLLTDKNLKSFGLEEKDFVHIPLYKAVGCKHCNQGYRGRIAFFELLPLTNTVKELILSGSSVFTILQQAETEGMQSLYQSGLEKLKAGLTTLDELQRVTVNHNDN